MTMIFRYAIVAIIIFNVSTSFAQRPPKYDPSLILRDVPPIVCPASKEVSHHHVPHVKKKSPYKKMELELIPTYSQGFPAEAKTAIEERVFPLIMENFSSPVPINIEFTWKQDDLSTLASAIPTIFIPNPVPYARVLNVFYPGPLAEKIAREDLNPGQSDIEISINSTTNWCFDCETPSEVGARQDFVSTVLHELYHGLGFTAFSNVVDNLGAIQTSQGISALFNNFMELRDGDRTILVPDGSDELLNHFQSNQLFFNLPSAGKVKLFAPNPYQGGSSISHLDEATYNGGNNALMTPSSSVGEVERSAGIANDMMWDMGWVYTYLLHEEEDLTVEKPVDQDFVVSVDIISEGGIIEDSLKLHYSTDEFENEDIEVSFTKIDDDTYQAIIPASGDLKIVDYYIEVTDMRDVRYSNPGINVTGTQFTYQYAFGPDNIVPLLTHDPVLSIKSVDKEIPLSANSSDVFSGLENVVIEWKYNGNEQTSIPMELDTNTIFTDDKYDGVIELPTGLSAQDLLEYRIVATDRSTFMNKALSPNDGYHQVEIEEIASALNLYINDFNSITEDFEGEGFSITQPQSFSNPAIHSEHPYTAADELNLNTLNFTYELKTPIVIEQRGRAIMQFDEIVLVEPGEPGTVFGDEEFWDYVIVEGKKLGSDWKPFLPGYDSSSEDIWYRAFNGGIAAGQINSDRTGDLTLFRPRTIDLLENGNFSAGDTVIVRFRLFSDPLVKGWGWAIDNLRIQEPSTAVEDFVLEENFDLIPNPTFDEVTVALDLENTTDQIQITIVDLMGRRLMTDRISNPDISFRKKYSVGHLADGIYFVNVSFNKKDVITRKLVVKK